MDHKRRGIALIFNHERFFWHLTLPERQGTSADWDNLTQRFSDLGFEVKCFKDLGAEELLKINKVSTSSHVDADCFLCVFLSHGEGKHTYAYDTKIEIQTLTGLFKEDKYQNLVGKPKIFIIQACACASSGRGESSDRQAGQCDPGGCCLHVHSACRGRLPHVLLCRRRVLLSRRNCEPLQVHSGFV